MPSYASSVGRLLEARCSPCHFAGGLADHNFDFSSYANVFAFNYDAFSPLALALNAPGGNVAVGTTTPGSKFDVVGASSGLGIRCTMSGSLINTQNIAVMGVGNSGGGINGTGIARDAAGRGLRVVLVEQNDLASGTSSASSKLIHGGLRYL